MKRKIIAIIILIIVVAGLALWGVQKSKIKPINSIEKVQEEEGFPIKIGYLTIGDLQQTVELTGSIKPLDRQIVTAKVSGKVDEVYVREGENVHKGQVILKIEQDTFIADLNRAKMALNQQKATLSQAIVDKQNTVVQTDANVKSAKLNLQSAKEALKLAKQPYRNQQILQQENAVNSAEFNYNQSLKDVARYKALYEKGAVSLSDYEALKLKADVNKKTLDSAKEQLSLLKEQGRNEDIRRAQLAVQSAEETLRQAKSNALAVAMKDESIKMAKAAIDSAQAAVDIAQNALDSTVVKSKIDGVMSTRNVEPGQTIGAGSALGEIVSLKDMYYLADVSEMNIDKVSQGQSVDVGFDAIANQYFKGVVAAIYPVADASTRSYSVKIKISDASSSIKAGMFAKGLLNTVSHKNVIICPKAAVKQSQGITSIFVLADEGKTVKQVQIEIVSSYLEEYEIKALKADELKGDEKIAVAGIESLSDGSNVALDDGKSEE